MALGWTVYREVEMKINRKFNTILLALVMVFIAFTTNAKAGEVYTAVARGYYDHPVTHVVEDPGNNPGIGEGMVNNVVYGVALIEKDDDGKLYATVRYNLRDKIKDVVMWVQNRGDSGFSQVPVKEISNGGTTGDFRFEIPSADCVVKSSFFVEPMGRAVIFFVDFDDLQEGGGNGFKVSVKTDKPVKNEDRVNEHTKEVSAPTSSSVQAATRNSGSRSNTSSTSANSKARSENNKSHKKSHNNKKIEDRSNKTKSGLKSSNKSIGKPVGPPGSGDKEERINQADLGYKHGLLTNKDFDDSQTLVGTSQKDEKTPWGPFTRALFTIIIVMIAILLTIVMLGAIGIAVLYKYKKRKNMELEEILVSRNSDMIGGGIDD